MIAGSDPLDPTASAHPVSNYERLLDRRIRGLKVGIPRNHYYDGITRDVRRAMDESLAVLRSLGAKDIYVCATHAAFCGPAIERLRALPIKEIVVTNTIPIPPEQMLPNMRVVSVGPLLAEVIRRVHEGRSVGALFNE